MYARANHSATAIQYVHVKVNALARPTVFVNLIVYVNLYVVVNPIKGEFLWR